MPKPLLRTKWNYDRSDRSSALVCMDETLCQQNFALECDINEIVRRFGLTGELPTNLAVPQQGDFDQVYDFHSALNMLKASEEAFAMLPADVRFRFGNDAGKLVEFVSDESNREEAEKLGIVVPRKGSSSPEPEVPATPLQAEA